MASISPNAFIKKDSKGPIYRLVNYFAYHIQVQNGVKCISSFPKFNLLFFFSFSLFTRRVFIIIFKSNMFKALTSNLRQSPKCRYNLFTNEYSFYTVVYEKTCGERYRMYHLFRSSY